MAIVSKGDLRRFAAPTATHTVTATGATTVNVAYPSITAGSFVDFSLLTVGGTIAGAPYLFTKTPGVGFGFRAGASDTSQYIFRVT